MKDYYGKELKVGDKILSTCPTNSAHYTCGVITAIHKNGTISAEVPYLDFRKECVVPKKLILHKRNKIVKMFEFDTKLHVDRLNISFHEAIESA